MSVKHWGSGPETALLLHCTLAQGGAWGPMARHLRDRFTMIAPDLLSHGNGPTHDASRDFHEQATAEAATHLPQTPTHLIGHSFGATIALRLALDHPARVKSLTLIEPVLFCAATGPGRAAHDALTADIPSHLAYGDKSAAARIFLSLWGAEPFDAMAPALQSYVTDRIWIPAACEPALTSDTANLLPRLSRLQTPTLLLQGDRSPPVIAEILTRLAKDIPHARRQIIPNAAHMAPLTHPQATAAAISRAL
ncbi:alpha/beta hydrolase [Rhodobacteraceae bacterium M385]|nr:alpha/beta hydrolase [Rhodobacteraceae bacterium M385]